MENLIKVLPSLLGCIVGIFVVSGVIIGITSLLNKITEKKN
ncbi:MAG TPA: oxaloacetate decarboxylase [Bacillota bacterium]|nr:oxaloacetate decarboxylase [Bacillota bacterium]HPP84865.1 oxaloacetate decarboxylase [Bacillota bacterium]